MAEQTPISDPIVSGGSNSGTQSSAAPEASGQASSATAAAEARAAAIAADGVAAFSDGDISVTHLSPDQLLEARDRLARLEDRRQHGIRMRANFGGFR